jgi:CTD kinase subunit gamma
MDPFEVRIRFTQHLQHLNASVTSANKAAQYALKYRDMDEDLHSCILEQLEKVSFFSFPSAIFTFFNAISCSFFLLSFCLFGVGLKLY